MLTIYEVHFTDGSTDTFPVSAMASEVYRDENGAPSSLVLVKRAAKLRYHRLRVAKIVRALTGEVCWEDL